MIAAISPTLKKIFNLKILKNRNQLVKLVRAILISYLIIKPTIKPTNQPIPLNRTFLVNKNPFNKNLK